MRYAILSDIHANAQAWQAVRADVLAQRIDAIICLGDIVGYGPDPVDVLADVRATCHHFVLGNHDAAAAGMIDSSVFSHDAHRIIAWTARRIDPETRAWFGTLPYVIEAEELVFVHAETPDPTEFGYVEDPDDAAACFAASAGRLIWFGHTHVPGVFTQRRDGGVGQQAPTDFLCAKGTRYLINVGSVGDPRDGRTVSSYCIYDDETDAVYFRSVPFDLDAFRERLASTGLEFTPWFLREEARTLTRKPGVQDMHAAKVATLRIRTTDKRTRIVIRPVAPLGVHTALGPGPKKPKARRSRIPYVVAGVAALALGGALLPLWLEPDQGRGATHVPAESPHPPEPEPDPWVNQDVGTVLLAGGVHHDAGVFAMVASGWDIWEKADAFHFVHRQKTGNGSIVARVANIEHTNPWSKAGVTIRESLAAGSRHAIMVVTPSNNAAMQYRLQTDAISAYATGMVCRAPWWVQLERKGDDLIGSASADGSNWVAVNRVTLTNLPATVYWGLCLTSHETTKLCRATIDNLQLDGVIEAIPDRNRLLPPGSTRAAIHRKPGLAGAYYLDPGFARRVATRIDPAISFNWGRKPPFPAQSNAAWSIRWLGTLTAPKSGSYTLSMVADDFADVKMGGSTILKGTSAKKTMNLVAGQEYPLDIGLRQDLGDASIRLDWAFGKNKATAIPASAFWHTTEQYFCFISWFTSSMDRWRVGSGIVNLEQKDGCLTGTIEGQDPHIVRHLGENDEPVDLQGFGTVYLRLQNGTAATRAAISFATDTAILSDKTRLVFPIQAQSQQIVTYRIDLSQHPLWKGQLKALRIDPAEPSGTETLRGTFRIDDIRVGEAPAYAN